MRQLTVFVSSFVTLVQAFVTLSRQSEIRKETTLFKNASMGAFVNFK